MKTAFTAVLAIAIVATAAPPAAPPATTQSLEQRMIEIAPALTIDDPETKSLDVQMLLDMGHTQFLLRSLYEAPDRRALYISDPRDGTPLCIVAGDRLILYDPIEGVLRVAENATGQLELKAEVDSLTINFGFDLDQQGKPWLTNIDLASIVRHGRATKVQELGDGIYGLRQRGSKETSVMFAAIGPRRPCPYLRVEMMSDGKAAIVIDPIRRNEPINLRGFEILPNGQLAERIPVETWPGKGVFAAARGSQVLMQILLARVAVGDPKWRAELERNWLTRIDWAKVKENDEKLAPILRELFPLATAARSGGGASTKPAAVSNDPAAPPAQ